MPAWPPTASDSSTTVVRPSDEAYTAAASPAGPAPTTATSTTASSSMSVGVPKARSATSRTLVGEKISRSTASTSGKVGVPPARAMTSRPRSLSGE